MAQAPFLEWRLDDRITAGASATIAIPGRTKTYGPTGDLSQNFIGSIQTMKFDIVPGIRSAEQFFAVQDAFLIVLLTPYLGCRYKHWPDFRATLNNSRATLLEGSTTEVQLQRLHLFGGVEYLRAIYKPVASTVTVFRKRSAVTASIASTVDYTTGVATISGHADGDVYSWTGEFDIPVTFTDDEWSSQVIGYVGQDRLFQVSGSVKLEEIRTLVAA